MKRQILISFICVCILVVTYGIWQYQQRAQQRQLDTTAVVRQIRTLSRLETASFTIEKIIDEGTHDGVLKELLFGDRILLVAHGEVIAGFDFANIEPAAIQMSDKSITIDIGKPQILLTRLDNSQTKVYDRQRGLLAPNDTNLESQARIDAESAIRAAACQEKILDTASENARKQLTALLQAIGFVSITVNVQPSACT
jgi:hypothetical protein